MAAIQKTVTITLKDGSSASHTAQFIGYVEPSSGMVVVEACCCGDPGTASRHTFPNDITAYTEDQIQAEIGDHVQRVATHHASVHKAKDFMNGLAAGQPQAAAVQKPVAGA